MQKKGKALQRAAKARGGKAGLPAVLTGFTPVPRVYERHDGWTPERQRNFIAALAQTGCVTRAAAEVNMSQRNCYFLRNAPGAEEFRKAWDAAIDCGVALLKDIAFERAIEGVLVPVIAGGKVIGYQRKHNDALAIFILRHYGQDNEGKRTTINYFSSRAVAGAQAGGGVAAEGGAGASAGASAGAGAEASTTTIRTVIAGTGGGADREAAAATLEGFEGVALDPQANAAIMAALHACAARARAAEAALDQGGEAAADAMEDDPDECFIPLEAKSIPWRGTLEPPTAVTEVHLPEGEDFWDSLGKPVPEWAQHLYPGRGDAGGDAGGDGE